MASRPTPPGLGSLLLFLSAALLVYLPALLQAQFLNFDDPFFFGAQNGAFRQGGLGLILDPTATIANAYLPVSHLSLYVDLLLFGHDPLGSHLHSLLLHVCAAFVLARLLFGLGLNRPAAVCAAALFLLHPALVESTAWVSSRKDLLSGLFSFLCLGALLRGRLFLLGLFAFLALYSKGTALVLPLLAGGLLLVQARRGQHGPAWRGVLVLAAMSLLIGWHHSGVAAGQATMVAGQFEARLPQVPGAFLHYLTTAVWPVELNLLYPEVETMQAFAANLVPGLWVLGASAVAIALLWRRMPLLSGGLALFFLALTPFNTALPATAIAAADRYLYLALPGLALALVSLPRIGMPVTLVAALSCAALSSARTWDFVDSETVWRSSLDEDPDNAVALINLATERLTIAPRELDEPRELLLRAAKVARYSEHGLRSQRKLVDLALLTGDQELAVEHAVEVLLAAKSLTSSPRQASVLADAYLLAARLNQQAGRIESASSMLAELSNLAPNHAGMLAYKSGLLLVEAADEKGMVDRKDPRRAAAMALLARAEASSPHNYQVNLARAQWAFASDELFSAEKFFSRACRIDPRRAEAYLGRSQLFLSQGMPEDAERVAREGMAAGVGDPQLQFLVALSLVQQNRGRAARAYFEAYLDVRPGEPAASRSLAGLLAVETMRELYQLDAEVLEGRAMRISELDPQNPKGFLIRAVAERQRKNPRAALALLARAARSMPDDPEVRRLRAETERDRGYELLLTEGMEAAAMDHFLGFLELADEDIPKEAVRGILRSRWRQRLEAGRLALLDENLALAESRFRRCLHLLPDDLSPNLHLGMVLLKKGDETQEQALACFQRAALGQTRAERDPSLAVYYQILTLNALGRRKEAVVLVEDYLANHDEAASERELDRIRAAGQALKQGR